jgi:general secretion pathway protein H
LKPFGFTLIEILVVLIIISIVSATVLFTVHPNQSRQMENFSNELVDTLHLAAEEALLKSEILRMRFTNNVYIFERYMPDKKDDEHQWQPLNDNVLGPHLVPNFVGVSLSIKGEEFVDKEPVIIFSSSGDVTPFTIYIARKGEPPAFLITGEADGYISSKALR